MISSSAVYGYAGKTPIAEDQILKPLSEYGVSKAAQDTLCQMYHKTKGCQVAVARPFNLSALINQILLYAEELCNR